MILTSGKQWHQKCFSIHQWLTEMRYRWRTNRCESKMLQTQPAWGQWPCGAGAALTAPEGVQHNISHRTLISNLQQAHKAEVPQASFKRTLPPRVLRIKRRT